MLAQDHYCHILGLILFFVCRQGIVAINWAMKWMENDNRIESMPCTVCQRTFLSRNYFQLFAAVASLFPNTMYCIWEELMETALG